MLDAFFASIEGLVGEIHIFPVLVIGMAIFGLWTTSRLRPDVVRAGNWSRDAPVRTGNIVMPVTSVIVYSMQLAFGVGLLFS